MENSMKVQPRRKIDYGSLALAILGVATGALSYCLVENGAANVLIIVPSIIAATTGFTHLVKWEIPHRNA